MLNAIAVRLAAFAAAIGVVAFCAVSVGVAEGQQSGAGFLRDGEAGFIVSEISYGLSDNASATGACPNGMSQAAGSLEALVARPATPQNGTSASNESDNAAAPARIAEFRSRLEASAPTDLCLHPELAEDPNFRTVTGRDVPVRGIDLDGQNARADGAAAPGTCAHDDFRGADGGHGIDNQFFRAVGCINSFQPEGQSNDFQTGMRTGAWGILVTLKNVDDIRNDPDVEVSFYASADPIQLSPNREPLANVTYAADSDPNFRATTHGRITNGVLTTDPVDMRFHYDRNGMYLERSIRHARLQATLSADGVIDGYLAGYSPIEAMYDLQFGQRTGRMPDGEIAPLYLRLLTANGASRVLGYTCNGAYHALLANADGDRDPETGRCTSISTQYRIRAIPAFVIAD